MRNLRSITTRPPLAPDGTTPGAWNIGRAGIEEGFLERWFSALSENEERHLKMRQFDGHWERGTAVADLNRNCSLFSQYQNTTLAPPGVHFQLFLWRELRAYGSHLNRVVEINRTMRDCSVTLAAAHSHAERGAIRSRLSRDLGPLFEQLYDLRLRILEVEKNYWDKVFCVGSFTNDSKELLDVKFPTMRRLGDSLRIPLLKQERNLDSTFQIRVGDLLREYGTNPYGKRLSLQTISRLVLLVYICAGLALDIEGDLTIGGSNPHRKLTVERTYETLRDAGLR